MASSVTVNDKLRKKIKRLAAEHDTTQGEIIQQAINLFEMTKSEETASTIPKSRNIIKEFILNKKREEWKKQIRKKLEQPGIDIDELRMEFVELE